MTFIYSLKSDWGICGCYCWSDHDYWVIIKWQQRSNTQGLIIIYVKVKSHEVSLQQMCRYLRTDTSCTRLCVSLFVNVLFPHPLSVSLSGPSVCISPPWQPAWQHFSPPLQSYLQQNDSCLDQCSVFSLQQKTTCNPVWVKVCVSSCIPVEMWMLEVEKILPEMSVRMAALLITTFALMGSPPQLWYVGQ